MLNVFVTPQIVGGVVRHFMGGAGVWLSTNGYATGSEIELITGGVAAAAAVRWSVLQKKLAR